jgi:hypothetical protein
MHITNLEKIDFLAIKKRPQKKDVNLYTEHTMAGVEGFEPPMPGPKPGALPLGYTPNTLKNILSKKNAYSSLSALRPESSKVATF